MRRVAGGCAMAALSRRQSGPRRMPRREADRTCFRVASATVSRAGPIVGQLPIDVGLGSVADGQGRDHAERVGPARTSLRVRKAADEWQNHRGPDSGSSAFGSEQGGVDGTRTRFKPVLQVRDDALFIRLSVESPRLSALNDLRWIPLLSAGIDPGRGTLVAHAGKRPGGRAPGPVHAGVH